MGVTCNFRYLNYKVFESPSSNKVANHAYIDVNMKKVE